MMTASTSDADVAAPADAIVAPAAARPDWLTVAAIAAIVESSATLIHEGLGHGGACVLTGCVPQLVTSMQFVGDDHALSSGAVRIIAAGGSVANLVAAAITIAVLRRWRDEPNAPAGWFFLWLLATVNLLHAAGYLLYSGVANIGDWAVVVRGFEPVWLWRIILAVVGGVSYWLVVRVAMARLGERLGASGPPRVHLANRYTVLAYITGGGVAIAAGLRDPSAAALILISGAAASLGGTSGLAWGPQLLHDPALGSSTRRPLRVTRDWRWIVAGTVFAAAFVFWLGPGIRLG